MFTSSRRWCGIFVISSIVVSSAFSKANEDKPTVIADFELGEVGKVPPGWFLPAPSANAGFKVETSESNPKQGQRCAVLMSGEKTGFGNLMTNVDAKPFRGKLVRIRAAVKSDVAKSAPLMFWVRVDRVNDETGYFNNMGDRPITKQDWTYYEHDADIADDATNIAIGLMFTGIGKAWIDDVTFQIIGKIGEGNQAPAPLSRQGLTNVVAFAKLVGYVRFFHPSDESAKTKWDQFVINHVALAESAKDQKELVMVLNQIFQPIAPRVEVFASEQPPPAVGTPEDSIKSFLFWRHDGVNLGNPQLLYTSKRVPNTGELFGLMSKLPKGISAPNPQHPLIADLGGGVSASVPLAVFTDDKGTLPRASAKLPASGKPTNFVPNGNDRTTRLASVILAWNVFQHFYPYFDVVKTDWSAELPKALNRAATDADETVFLETMKRLVAALKDGHGSVMHAKANRVGNACPPLQWDWIENKLVVTDVIKNHARGIEPGDIVTGINGVPVQHALAKVEELISGATPQWIRHRSLTQVGLGPNKSELDLMIEHNGEKKQVGVARSSDFVNIYYGMKDKAAKIKEIKPGIWYLDIDRINDADFTETVPKLEKATGIIFDLRGYPGNLSTNPIGHMTDKSVTCAQWHIPLVILPDRKDMTFSFSNWHVPPRKPRFTAKIAFITDGRAISYAETYLGIIEHYKLAEIVGAPTAGTNGNVNPLTFPGGYRVSWTGMKVLKHDGSQHHGIGIQPTVPVQRTIQGVKDSKDEFLEKAIAVVGG